MAAIRRALAFLWRTDKPLTATGVLMLGVLVPCLIGLAVDDRLITGAPAWLKPAKFAASTALYSLTLAWIFSYLPDWPRTRRWAGWTTAVVFVGEIAVIDMQAWRGTSSHFNTGTPFDAVVFASMGAAIVVQTLVTISVAVALWRQTFADKLIGTALRAGMTITLIGAAAGGLMTRPTSEQLAAARQTHRMPLSGAHTVGAPDGGPGLPGTGWSREHGDLRVPHFVGLHAIQALVLVALALRRRGARPAMMQVAAVSYLALFVILMRQALFGEALLQPGTATLAMLAAWALATMVAGWAASSWAASSRPPAQAMVA